MLEFIIRNNCSIKMETH